MLIRFWKTALEDSSDAPGKVLVRILFIFLHIYSATIDEDRNILGSAFVRDWEEDREWRFFERIIAEYEALRTNILIGDGRKEATLGDINKGALGRAETLDLTVMLKDLSIVKAARQFPKIGGLTDARQERDWRSGVVAKNADDASSADVFVYRENADAKSLDVMCALQAKKVGRLSAETLTFEYTKNKNAIQAVPNKSTLDNQGIKKARTITVFITTADTDSAHQSLGKTPFPEDCLLIHRGNFAGYFGEAFSVPAAFAATNDRSLNFKTREDLQKKHKLSDVVVDQVIDNMPYRSYDDLVAKVPAMGSVPHTEVEFLPYGELGHTRKIPRVL